MMTGQARSKGMTQGELEMAFRHEMADVLGHTLLLARFHGIDLMAAVDEKWLRRVAGRIGGQRGVTAASLPA